MFRRTLFSIVIISAAVLAAVPVLALFPEAGVLAEQDSHQQLDQAASQIDSMDAATNPLGQAPESTQKDQSLYNCGGCQLIARSDSRHTKKEGLQCATEVAAAVIEAYKADTVTPRYQLSHQRIRRVHSPSGSEALIKKADFFDLNFTPDDQNHGFIKNDFSCSNGLQGIARCYDCTKA